MVTNSSDDQASNAAALEVYWRPGCPFCSRLLRVLDDAAVVVRLHNIWQDDEARAFVRAHNRGDETVPTIAVGNLVATNPEPAALLERLRTEHPHLVGSPGPAPRPTSGPTPGQSR